MATIKEKKRKNKISYIQKRQYLTKYDWAARKSFIETLRDLSDSIFVELKIGVDAPVDLAALRPCLVFISQLNPTHIRNLSG